MEPNEERKMMEQLFESAVKDFIICEADSEEYNNACLWLFDDSIDAYPSFRDLCKVLDFNIIKARFAIKQLLDRKIKKPGTITFDRLFDKCR